MANIPNSTLDRSVDKTNIWLRDIGEQFGVDDRERALRALRATLHAVRDRLTIEEGAHFSAQLPLIVRGLFYEGWVPARTPISADTLEDFIADIQEMLPGEGATVPPTEAYRAVFAVLKQHMGPGVLDHVKTQLSDSIAAELG